MKTSPVPRGIYGRLAALIAGDLLLLGGLILGVAQLYLLCGGEYQLSNYFRLWPLLPVFVLVNNLFGLYHGNLLQAGVPPGAAEELRRGFYSIVILFLLLTAWLFAAKIGGQFSRLVLGVSFMLAVVLFPLERFLVRLLLKKLGLGKLPVVIIGAGRAGQRIADICRNSLTLGLEPVAFFDDDPQLAGRRVENLPVAGPIAEAPAYLDEHGIGYAVIAVPAAALRPVLERFVTRVRHLLIIPDTTLLCSMGVSAHDIEGVLGLELSCSLLEKRYRWLKAAVDWVGAAVLVLVLSPVFLLLALLVGLTSGWPVLYRARRLGKNGRHFKIIKFRTMCRNADSRLQELLRSDPELEREWRTNYKLRHDPRITRIGNFLRRTSLDELPQLFNVLAGDMSLVGPRPIIDDEVPCFGRGYELRSKVRPGITGLWQVSGRSDIDYEERVELDVAYIMNWSLWLDYLILLRTIRAVFCGRGAR